MSFYPGQEVVCIRDFPPLMSAALSELWPRLPKKGEHFIVRDFYSCHCGCGEGVLCFEEIICGLHPIYKNECGYMAKFFRPVKPTSIKIFTDILEKAPEKVTA